MTSAGKVDRRALPEPAPDPGGADRADGPRGHLERLVLAVWGEVLGHSGAGRDDNFFEVGGHSMAVIDVRTLLAQRLGRAVPVVDLFRNPTARQLARYLAGRPDGDEVAEATARGLTRRRRATRAGARHDQQGVVR
jgi:hypothetical protein